MEGWNLLPVHEGRLYNGGMLRRAERIADYFVLLVLVLVLVLGVEDENENDDEDDPRRNVRRALALRR